METKLFDHEENFQKQLKDSQEFVNYWVEIIQRKICLKLNPIHSVTLQQKVLCDTQEGIEFKFDRIMKSSGNFWIEFEEKHHPDQEEYIPSGILRKDNTWLWAVGDFETLYFFPKKALLSEYRKGCSRVLPNDKKTSRAFLLPIEQATKISILELTPIEKKELAAINNGE